MVIKSLKDVVSPLADALLDDVLLFDVLLVDENMLLSNSLLVLNPEMFMCHSYDSMK